VVTSNQTDGWVDGSFCLDRVPSKGPLALITLALFGDNSPLDPGLYQPLPTTYASNPTEGLCYTYSPLTFLISDMDAMPMPCNGQFDQSAVYRIYSFFDPQYGIPALSRAAFLANQALFQMAGQGKSDVLFINSQPTFDLTRLDISMAAMIGLYPNLPFIF